MLVEHRDSLANLFYAFCDTEGGDVVRVLSDPNPRALLAYERESP